MSKRSRLPVILAALVLAAVALTGYMTPERPEKTPVRILLDSSGGKVIFDHLTHHRAYKIPCVDCHHEGGAADGEKPIACGACHAKSFDADYVREHINSFPDQTYCVKCHHAEFAELAFDHAAHEEYAGQDCQVCHHGPDIEATPQACGDCHTLAGDDGMPSVRDAAHERCIQCHADMFDKGLKGCTPCHRMKDMEHYDGPYTGCQQCHQSPAKELILTRTDAFHDQCMDCHEKHGKGPYGDADCNQCHMQP